MSKKNTPTVSYVIRTKNEGRFIGKVLKLVYQQTFKDFEVIIVDSGSTDSTLKKVKKFPTRLIKIKPHEYNHSYALNLGIKHSLGKYICIISGHSLPISSNTWLTDGLKHFENKKVAGVSGWSKSNPLAYISRIFGRYDFSMLPDYVINTPNLTNTNSIIRKDLWKIYPFDEELSGSEDYDWGLEMVARGYIIVKDKKFSVYHSHLVLGKMPRRFAMKKIWEGRRSIINLRVRPRNSYTKLKI